jgi:hypothetical protein
MGPNLASQPLQQRHTSLRATVESEYVEPGVRAGHPSSEENGAQDQQLDSPLHDPHLTCFSTAAAGNNSLHGQAQDSRRIGQGMRTSENTILSPVYAFQCLAVGEDSFVDLQPDLTPPEELLTWPSQTRSLSEFFRSWDS